MSPRAMRLPALGAIVVLAVAAPAGASAAATGKVRLVNGTPGAGTITLWVDRKRMTTAAYGSASVAVSVSVGKHRFAITTKGSSRSLAAFPTKVTVSSGGSYTIGAAGTAAKRGKAKLFWFSNSKAFIVGAVKVRAVHLLAGGPAIDVGPRGLPVIRNVRYGHASSYIALPATSSTYGYSVAGYGYTNNYGYGITIPLVVTKHGTGIVLKSYTLKVKGGRNYSAFAVKSGSSLKVVLVRDA